jgi:hypothetical protein
MRARAAPAAVGACLALALVAGCDREAEQPPGPVQALDRGQGFELVLQLPRDRFTTADAIEVVGSLTWNGPAPKATVWSGDPGPITFLIKQLDGRLSVGGVMETVCNHTDFALGVPGIQRYDKSVGFSNTDPDAAFYRAFVADPVLHLPPGRWRVTATVDGMLAACDGQAPRLDLAAQLDFVVE